MINLAERLDLALRSVGVPIDGVSIGDLNDRSTWRVDFRPEATPAQRAQAVAIVAAFAPPTAAQILDEDAQRETDMTILKAIVIELHAIIPAPKPTVAQLRANILARYKALS